jgi:hypothetical protein
VNNPEDRLTTLENKIDALVESHGRVIELMENIKDEIAPTLDHITSSAPFRMMFGKGKTRG